jgi:peptidoglycan/xylan/chitin deacetylase (PgdA/CDA1 family)
MTVREWASDSVYRGLYQLTGPGRGMKLILFYHSVGRDAPHSVPVDRFEEQMKSLRERFEIVRLSDFVTAFTSESRDAAVACVTFDDGYLDNYQCALPVLDRSGIKATFFIATNFLGKSFRTFAGELPMMTEAHVRELAAWGHEVGAHTMSHSKLTKLPINAAKAEIAGSKRFLEDLLGCGVVSFAYPKGDCNPTTKELVRESGFSFAVTVRPGIVHDPFDCLALPRVWINNTISAKGFHARLSPALERYQSIRERLRWAL